MYITVDDMRREGVSDPPYTNEYVEGRIAIAQSLVEELTGQFFEAREDHRIRLTGTGHAMLWLPVPPTAEDADLSVTIDGEAVDPELYEIDLDDRLNPKLVRVRGCWPQGRRMVITGTFGYVDDDGKTPAAIKDVMKRIVMHKLPQIGDVEAQRRDSIIREKLKDYEYQLRDDAQRAGDLFGDPHVAQMISMFRQTRIGTT